MKHTLTFADLLIISRVTVTIREPRTTDDSVTDASPVVVITKGKA